MPLDFEAVLRLAVEHNASDIHLKVGSTPILRIDGKLERVSDCDVLRGSDIFAIIERIASDDFLKRFQETMEMDTSYLLKDVARFRVNACIEDGKPRVVMRTVPLQIKTLEELQLPPILTRLCTLKNGLALFTGPTGSGKSTSLAAMIDRINSTRTDHIVTIEDPLEFIHVNKAGIVTQREVGIDTLSFSNALRASLRQDPDVILIGEMRDSETVQTALSAAETGHFVLSTLHTVDAVETLHRILEFFQENQQMQIRNQLASVLRCICSQRIMPRIDGEGRIVAAEILIGNRTVREFIQQCRPFKEIVKLIEDGASQYGMQTFDQSLYSLWKEKIISKETALLNATSSKDLQLRMQGLYS
ncbi:MAG TPA: PilT/PilU family type 4a pilus ATPase [Candidatus Hydrogenedentes bacterium]|jgi:twitching motility protein PilT|nr:MAG: Twitching mobility protein [Candidatus Hydrogenedentes bacterium ADurb.Bin170]HNZ48393.1 PilT/PilU family type 4a pilus ATPase [Candidatus Hydrogenedentota bacterium]HOD94544.1 PilT/PilU family type 4a pilus ATPase [Candidatus Hydrogenedentota bacterium]HOM48864.1 PilT/PilU family type 4a pilus ATPase [Candidatus Hydrogenedentota bacterium]HOR49920.1 PilT/PilU family type 4a pilus ATPase [Candidatus Hydrogenedentota bacterium]